VDWQSALWVGLASVVGVQVGVLAATSLPEDTLRRLFGILLLGVSAQLAWRCLRRSSYSSS
jgi:uncharacterized membrane protein YfcA